MGFGRTGCTAAAVSSGSAAQQNHNITRFRFCTDDILFRSSRNDCTDFHTLGNIVGMINFLYKAGGKTDLVAIGTVAVGSGGDNLGLGQLARQSLIKRCQRISCTGNTHCLIDIGTAA